MVLTILSEREKMYAYEITKEALERSSGRYKMPLLYTTLNKLQEQGFVAEVEKIISDANRVRTVSYTHLFHNMNHPACTHKKKQKLLK